MSSSNRLRLISAVLIIAVFLSSVGFYFTSQTKTESQTSAITLRNVASTVASTQSTIKPLPRIEWITIGQVKPTDYYLSLLESNGTEPYVQLARELRKLPDLANATAVAKITYLALNATNPEVKEAFHLMIKGGTPDWTDFAYNVPSYNTELQILYWLASQNDLKRDDTLALAIGMVNGLWVTMGDDQVRESVRNDASQLLQYFRETNELQKQRGYYARRLSIGSEAVPRMDRRRDTGLGRIRVINPHLQQRLHSQKS